MSQIMILIFSKGLDMSSICDTRLVNVKPYILLEMNEEPLRTP